MCAILLLILSLPLFFLFECQGLTDDVHVVVKNSLVAFENILPHLLQHQLKKHSLTEDNVIVALGSCGATSATANVHKASSDSVINPPLNDNNSSSNNDMHNNESLHTAVGDILASSSATSLAPPNASINNETCNVCYGYNNNIGDDKNIHSTMTNVIRGLQLAFENKYWVVQCKYLDLISKLDFPIIVSIYGSEQGRFYEVNMNG